MKKQLLPALPRADLACFDMPPSFHLTHRVTAALALALCAGAAAIAGAAGCITTPPPDLLAPAPRRPTILHSSVSPPVDVPLTDWPADGTFIVPVEPGDPEHPLDFLWDVFVDYDPSPYPIQSDRGLKYLPEGPPPVVDAGIVSVSFLLSNPNGPADPLGLCHRVEFLVAHRFNPIPMGDFRLAHTPDSVGGDLVTWQFTPGGVAAGCPEYDAGDLQDGAFPDASDGGLPVVHQDGGK